jgi:hypothetical protein
MLILICSFSLRLRLGSKLLAFKLAMQDSKPESRFCRCYPSPDKDSAKDSDSDHDGMRYGRSESDDSHRVTVEGCRGTVTLQHLRLAVCGVRV